jgi:SAM-dependent methyltransferase
VDTTWKGSAAGAPVRESNIAPDVCPVCDAVTVRWHSIKGYPIYECIGCHHRFVPGARSARHVQETFDDTYFSDGGAGYPGYLNEGDILRERGRRYARILARHLPAGRMLDVGCAAGFILRGFLDYGWSGRGLEPNRAMVEFGRRRGLDLECGMLEDYRSEEQFDLIAMLQSIMHLYDLRRACEAAAALTKPGGFWLVEAFNPYSLTARLMGKYWHDYNPPSVLHWFSPGVLRVLLARYGLEQVAGGRAPKSISAAPAKSILRFKLGGSTGVRRAALSILAAVPDAVAIPYPGDDIYWALFRKRS